jgi:hypothetical protein
MPGGEYSIGRQNLHFDGAEIQTTRQRFRQLTNASGMPTKEMNAENSTLVCRIGVADIRGYVNNFLGRRTGLFVTTTWSSITAAAAIGQSAEAGSCGGRKLRHHPQQTLALGCVSIVMFQRQIGQKPCLKAMKISRLQL